MRSRGNPSNAPINADTSDKAFELILVELKSKAAEPAAAKPKAGAQ